MTIIIAEVAQAHDGSLGTAHAYIDAVAQTGADGIKFQTHIADAESTLGEPWRVKFSPQDESRYDYWKRMEFTEDQWHGLKQHADDKGLLFISSAFSLEAVELLIRVGVHAWKIASGEVSNLPILERMADAQLPFWISSGMSPWTEIDAAVKVIRSFKLPVTVFQCTSMYPTPPEKVGLNVIPEMQTRYPDCEIGLSDHSGTIYSGLAATTLGIDVLELHVTLSRDAFGPDVTSSVTIGELKQLVDGIKFINIMNANPIDKDQMALNLSNMRDLFTKSIVLQTNVNAGTVLTAAHLTVKKPGTGIPASQFKNVIGRQVVCDLSENHLLQESDLL